MSIFATSKPVLTYFDLYGKGEAIRMALVHSKTPFEDNRVSGPAWAAFKASAKCASGQIPVLEVRSSLSLSFSLSLSLSRPLSLSNAPFIDRLHRQISGGRALPEPV